MLIHSAGGGVGIAATQIAKRAGAEVYGTASPVQARALPRARRRPPARLHPPGWERGLPQFDVILDAIGGKSFRRSYELLRARRAPRRLRRLLGRLRRAQQPRSPRCARVVRMPRFNMIKQMSESKAVIGLNMLTLWKDRGTLEPWIEPLQELLADGTSSPSSRARSASRRPARRRR